MRWAWIPGLTLVAALSAAPARAQANGEGGDGQGAPPPVAKKTAARVPERVRSFDISIDGQWLGRTALGTRDATLTRNQQSASPYPYFTVDGRLASTVGVEARVGYAFTRLISVEGGFAYRRPQLQWATTNDSEGAPNTTIAARLSEYGFDAALLLHLRGAAFGRQKRAVPFVLAGAGYVRQVHQTSTLVDSGQAFYGGGGLKYLLSRRPGRVTGYGVRVDARVVYRHGGYKPLPGTTPISAVVTGGLFVSF